VSVGERVAVSNRKNKDEERDKKRKKQRHEKDTSGKTGTKKDQ